MSGININPAPPDAHTDGLSRAARSFVGGVIVTALETGGAGLLTGLGAIHWTKAYWAAMGTLALSSLALGAVSYAMRRWAPPKP